MVGEPQIVAGFAFQRELDHTVHYQEHMYSMQYISEH